MGDTRHKASHLSVWRSRQEICKLIGCSTRTLARKVRQGEIERRQDGRKAFFRLVSQSAPQSETRDTKRATEARHETQSETHQLVNLIEQLTAKLTATEHEKASLEYSNQLLQQQLNQSMEALTDAELAWSRLQGELIQTRADVARAHLLLRRNAQSSEPIT